MLLHIDKQMNKYFCHVFFKYNLSNNIIYLLQKFFINFNTAKFMKEIDFRTK